MREHSDCPVVNITALCESVKRQDGLLYVVPVKGKVKLQEMARYVGTLSYTGVKYRPYLYVPDKKETLMFAQVASSESSMCLPPRGIIPPSSNITAYSTLAAARNDIISIALLAGARWLVIADDDIHFFHTVISEGKPFKSVPLKRFGFNEGEYTLDGMIDALREALLTNNATIAAPHFRQGSNELPKEKDVLLNTSCRKLIAFDMERMKESRLRYPDVPCMSDYALLFRAANKGQRFVVLTQWLFEARNTYHLDPSQREMIIRFGKFGGGGYALITPDPKNRYGVGSLLMRVNWRGLSTLCEGIREGRSQSWTEPADYWSAPIEDIKEDEPDSPSIAVNFKGGTK